MKSNNNSTLALLVITLTIIGCGLARKDTVSSNEDAQLTANEAVVDLALNEDSPETSRGIAKPGSGKKVGPKQKKVILDCLRFLQANDKLPTKETVLDKAYVQSIKAYLKEQYLAGNLPSECAQGVGSRMQKAQ